MLLGFCICRGRERERERERLLHTIVNAVFISNEL